MDLWWLELLGLLAWLVQLVKNGQITQDHATLWTAVVLAVFSPALASIFAPNGLRTYLFLVAGALQGLLVGFGAWSNNAGGALVIALLGALGTSSLAAANVNRVLSRTVRMTSRYGPAGLTITMSAPSSSSSLTSI